MVALVYPNDINASLNLVRNSLSKLLLFHNHFLGFSLHAIASLVLSINLIFYAIIYRRNNSIGLYVTIY